MAIRLSVRDLLWLRNEPATPGLQSQCYPFELIGLDEVWNETDIPIMFDMTPFLSVQVS